MQASFRDPDASGADDEPQEPVSSRSADEAGGDKGRGVPWHLVPMWAGATAAAGLLVALVLLIPDVRAWLARRVVYPVAAQVLGRDEILVEGVRIPAAPEPGVTTAFAVMVILLLLGLRVLLADRPRAVWSRRLRLDAPFVLSLVPYLALAPVLVTLSALQLFQVPWAFFAVPPVLVVLVVAFVLVSLVFAFWVEAGGRRRGPSRFLMSVGLFLVVGLVWIVLLGGTTVQLAWWIPLAAVVLVAVVHYSVTLGNRIHSHRRALFSLGCFHLAFFSGFLVLWFLEGPWPVQDWSLASQAAQRELAPHADGVLLLVLALGPALLIGVGAYTLGAFLHRYTAWARVWVDGLSLLVLFAQVLEGWVVTLMVTDPYGALDYKVDPPGVVSAWMVGQWGGWGYFWGKLLFVVALILVLSLPARMRAGRALELRNMALGIFAGIGLVAGLRYALMLCVGI